MMRRQNSALWRNRSINSGNSLKSLRFCRKKPKRTPRRSKVSSQFRSSFRSSPPETIFWKLPPKTTCRSPRSTQGCKMSGPSSCRSISCWTRKVLTTKSCRTPALRFQSSNLYISTSISLQKRSNNRGRSRLSQMFDS